MHFEIDEATFFSIPGDGLFGSQPYYIGPTFPDPSSHLP